ncbi:MAG TPA: dephospho-CoA kinase [Pilimelia sp.]|nr:dephospho-CoA kinase [Pilimelia sp.]
MLRVGLTGGIGAGKSAVAARLAAHGAVVVDADRLAREVVEPGTAGLAEVVAEFGPSVLAADGALDRAALGRLAFGDPAARRRLEAIVHPRVRRRAAAMTAAAPAGAVVVHDIPLLVETGQHTDFPLVVVVAAAEGTRLARLVRDRGMAVAEARGRIRAQADDATRAAAADVLLDNGGPRPALHDQVDHLWARRLAPFAALLRAGTPAPWPAPAPRAPDPCWPPQARRLVSRLRRALGPELVRADHIGGTAVPGLPAWDLVEVQAVVHGRFPPDLADATGLVPAPAAWPAPGGDAPAALHPGRADALLASADPGRPTLLRLYRGAGPPGGEAVPPGDGPPGGDGGRRQEVPWQEDLLLRDWLRADAAARADYLAAVSAAPGAHPGALARWRAEAVPRARRWARAARWRP